MPLAIYKKTLFERCHKRGICAWTERGSIFGESTPVRQLQGQVAMYFANFDTHIILSMLIYQWIIINNMHWWFRSFASEPALWVTGYQCWACVAGHSSEALVVLRIDQPLDSSLCNPHSNLEGFLDLVRLGPGLTCLWAVPVSDINDMDMSSTFALSATATIGRQDLHDVGTTLRLGILAVELTMT